MNTLPETQPKKIRLTLAYDGTDFYGFQRQAGVGLPTIQESLETAIFRFTGKKATVEGSGRTDTGVHALGQVVHFMSDNPIPPDKWRLALLQYLPDSIIIKESSEAPPDFHARFSAADKTYMYQYCQSPTPDPFLRRYSYHVPYGLDLPAMAEAAGYFTGSHDFRAFCASGSKVKSFVREIYDCALDADAPLIRLTVRGNGFLWHMVRIMAGTILEVGAGKRLPRDIPALIKAGDRRLAGVTLPARGLILGSVRYP